MDPKVFLLKTLRDRIKHVRNALSKEQEAIRIQKVKSPGEISGMKSEEAIAYRQAESFRQQRIRELSQLADSPFFAKCVLKGNKEYYFGKYSFPVEKVYSWIAPIASIRFEKPGSVSYRLPNKKTISSVLTSKDQYLIVNGKVIFYATEGIDTSRTLIHQEHFSNRKSAFVLPEIVAVMEKAQDKVIRADHKGAFAIRGPAGSGKTTLALHRVAYLVQSPETIDLYPGEKILVVVQDTGTKDYFSNLLPELGITNVAICTFFEWAFEILGRKDWMYAPHYDAGESSYKYEYEKIRALRNQPIPMYSKSTLHILEKAYSVLSKESRQTFKQQEKEKTLDRIDVTLLLMSYQHANKALAIQEELRIPDGNGGSKLKIKKEKLLYSLIVVDEFQNYLPEQLRLLKSCVNKDLQSIMYVGDIAQQVRLGTIKDWNEIGEDISEERDVVLHKVYRNTKQILSYIKGLGYEVEIPEGIKEGSDVKEVVIASVEESAAYLEKIIKDPKNGIIGVICADRKITPQLKEMCADYSKVHVLNMEEVQGVEFDTVCILGISKEIFAIPESESISEELRKDIKKIQKDLLYISLTRAISEMHVVGSCSLGEVTSYLLSDKLS